MTIQELFAKIAPGFRAFDDPSRHAILVLHPSGLHFEFGNKLADQMCDADPVDRLSRDAIVDAIAGAVADAMRSGVVGLVDVEVTTRRIGHGAGDVFQCSAICRQWKAT